MGEVVIEVQVHRTQLRRPTFWFTWSQTTILTMHDESSQELDSQSIDAYIIAGGEYINAVSVGRVQQQGPGGSPDAAVDRSGLCATPGGCSGEASDLFTTCCCQSARGLHGGWAGVNCRLLGDCVSTVVSIESRSHFSRHSSAGRAAHL